MNESTDAELLARFAQSESEEAFAALVHRHVHLVHSVALRHTANPHHAEEITQAVFLILARKARSLGSRTILSGWLYHTARLTAANYQRAEQRRARREQEAFMQSTLEEPLTGTAWCELAPLLDDAMARLGSADRDAVVLRYFENKSLQEVGKALGVEERAAQKRVSRALEKLRGMFTKRGVVSTTAIIAGAISAHSVQAAPPALATTISATALKGSTVAGPTLTLIKETLRIMAWTKAKTPIVVSAVVLILVGTAVEVRKARADEQPDDSWRSASLTWQQVGQTAPQVKILPTKFQPPVTRMLTSDGIKRGGINVSVREIVWAAYRCSPGRMAFTAGEPQEKYDFISTLPLGTELALQIQVKKTLGLTGRWENLETNVLALKVRTPDAPGLKPATRRPSEFGNLVRGHIHCFGQPLSWKPPMPPWGLTKQLERIFHMPIVDETGLEGSYNLDLQWRVETDPNANQEVVKQALIDQLGLELVPVQKRVDILIVEKVQ